MCPLHFACLFSCGVVVGLGHVVLVDMVVSPRENGRLPVSAEHHTNIGYLQLFGSAHRACTTTGGQLQPLD